MTLKDIALLRLQHQQISQTQFNDPAEVVRWLGVVQAQDYFGALWAVGLRTKSAVEADVEQALINKSIIRTWPFRGTLHFVAPEDVRWMLGLSRSRIIAMNASRMKREYDLDEKDFTKAKKILIRALQGGIQLQRETVYETLETAGIVAKGQRGLHIIWRLAQDGILCFGAREGKQQTFTLLDEWIPLFKVPSHDEALATLALRYFTGRGPATVHDFAWWAGLAPAEAKLGLEMVKSKLAEVKVKDVIYWMSDHLSNTKKNSSVYLLPSYDEFMVGYTDRSASLDTEYEDHGNGIFKPVIVFQGKVTGTWRRTLKKDIVEIEVTPFTALNKIQTTGLSKAIKTYGQFIDKKVI